MFSFAQAKLIAYWDSYFLSTESLYLFLKSFTEGIRRLSTWWFGNTKMFVRIATFVIPLFLFSMVYYGARELRQRRFRIESISSITLILFIQLIFLGMIKKYPFTGERITLFFAPFVFCMIVKAIAALSKWKWAYVGFVAAYGIFLVVCVLNNFIIYYKLYF